MNAIGSSSCAQPERCAICCSSARAAADCRREPHA